MGRRAIPWIQLKPCVSPSPGYGDEWDRENGWAKGWGGGGGWSQRREERKEVDKASTGSSRLLMDVAAAIHSFEETNSQPVLRYTDAVFELSQPCSDDDFHAMRTFTTDWDAFQIDIGSLSTSNETQLTIAAEVAKAMPSNALFSLRRGVWLSVFASSDGVTLSTLDCNEGISSMHIKADTRKSIRATIRTQVAIHSCQSCSAYFLSDTLESSTPAVISSELLSRYKASRTKTAHVINADHDAYRQSIDALRTMIEGLVYQDKRTVNLNDSLTSERLGKDGPIKEILMEYGYSARGKSGAYCFLWDLGADSRRRNRLLRGWLELTIISAARSDNQGQNSDRLSIHTNEDWLHIRRPDFRSLTSSKDSPPQGHKESQTAVSIQFPSHSSSSTQQQAATLVAPTSFHSPPRYIGNVRGQDVVLSWKDVIGQGGSGVVFKVTHHSFGEVAIKSTRPIPLDETEKHIRSFQSEARIWEQLKHPNILPFLGAITSKHNIYLISAFAPNGSLPDYLQTHPEADKLSLITQMARGLEYLHSKGYVHGDVKGSNVLVSSAAMAQLTDFGLSKAADTVTTTSRRGGGSTRWLSPEILMEGGGRTFRSDTFAFGMTIFEIYNGSIPYQYLQIDSAVIHAIVCGERPDTSIFLSIGRHGSSILQSLCQRCWDEDQWARPSMRDVLEELSSVPHPLHKSLTPIFIYVWLVLTPPFVAIALFSASLSMLNGPAAVLAAVLFLPLPSSFAMWFHSSRCCRRAAASSWQISRRLWHSLYCFARGYWYSLNDASQAVLVATLFIAYVSGIVALLLWYHTLAISEGTLGTQANSRMHNCDVTIHNICISCRHTTSEPLVQPDSPSDLHRPLQKRCDTPGK